MGNTPEVNGLTIAPSLPVVSPAPQEPPENPLLVRFRGHRTRTWGDAEAQKCLELVERGLPKEHAARQAGIPVSAIIRGHGVASDVLCEAIDAVYAHEGAAHFEALVTAGAEGLHDPKTAPMLKMALQLRGRLVQDKAQGVGANVGINVTIVTTPGPAQAPVHVLIEQAPLGASEGPGAGG